MSSWKKTLTKLTRQLASSEGTNSGDGLAGSLPRLPTDAEAPSSSILWADDPPVVRTESPHGAPLFPISLSPVSTPVLPVLLRDTQAISIEGLQVTTHPDLSPSSETFRSADSQDSPPGDTHLPLLGSPPSSPGMMMSSPEVTSTLPLALVETDLDPLPIASSSLGGLAPQSQEEISLSLEDMRRRLD